MVDSTAINEESFNVINFKSAKKFLLERLVDSKKRLFSQELGIYRTEAWMAELGNPQEDYPTIHIAGTTGKGSTSYMISSILKESGANIGTITSPHTYDVRERMLVNLEFVSEAEFCNLTRSIIKPIATLETSTFGRPTYFEAMVGMAHKLFADKNIDYGVVETGIGGRFDSTNTIKRNDKLAVITKLGLDHTEILGSSIESIGWQKSGIIPYGGDAIALLPDNLGARRIISQVARSRGSTIEFVDPKSRIKNFKQTTNGIKFDYVCKQKIISDIMVPTLGEYQAENASLAIATVEYLSKRDGVALDEDTIKAGFKKLAIPARSEIIDFNGTPVIIDAAHNPQKLSSFFELINSLELPKKPLIIFATKKDKDWQKIAKILSSKAAKVYATSFFMNEPKHLINTLINSDKIASTINTQGGQAEAFKNPGEALKKALSEVSSSQAIVITGSIYMIGELYDQLKIYGVF